MQQDFETLACRTVGAACAPGGVKSDGEQSRVEELVSTSAKKVVLAGVAAGIFAGLYDLVVNEVLLGELNAAGMNFEPAAGVEEGSVIGLFVLWSLVMSLVVSWTYSALRSSYGSGLKTAALAGVQVWAVTVLALVYPTVIGVFDWSYFARGAAVILVQMLLAANIARADQGDLRAAAL